MPGNSPAGSNTSPGSLDALLPCWWVLTGMAFRSGDGMLSVQLEKTLSLPAQTRQCGTGYQELSVAVWSQTPANKKLLVIIVITYLHWRPCDSYVPWIP